MLSLKIAPLSKYLGCLSCWKCAFEQVF